MTIHNLSTCNSSNFTPESALSNHKQKKTSLPAEKNSLKSLLGILTQFHVFKRANPPIKTLAPIPEEQSPHLKIHSKGSLLYALRICPNCFEDVRDSPLLFDYLNDSASVSLATCHASEYAEIILFEKGLWQLIDKGADLYLVMKIVPKVIPSLLEKPTVLELYNRHPNPFYMDSLIQYLEHAANICNERN